MAERLPTRTRLNRPRRRSAGAKRPLSQPARMSRLMQYSKNANHARAEYRIQR